MLALARACSASYFWIMATRLSAWSRIKKCVKQEKKFLPAMRALTASMALRKRAACRLKRLISLLRARHFIGLIWNDRRTNSTPFLRDYEALLQDLATDYKEIDHKNVQDKTVFATFFGSPPSQAIFNNIQRFDLAGLIGRLNSSSYVPGVSHPRYASLVRRAKEIFDAHQATGQVTFEYDTRVYYGRLV